MYPVNLPSYLIFFQIHVGGCSEVGYNQTDSICTICILENSVGMVNGLRYEGEYPFKTMYGK